MIEMLAVLTVMGVLTLTTIAGLRWILDKNEANGLVKEVMQQSSVIGMNKLRVKANGDVVYPYKNN